MSEDNQSQLITVNLNHVICLTKVIYGVSISTLELVVWSKIRKHQLLDLLEEDEEMESPRGSTHESPAHSRHALLRPIKSRPRPRTFHSVGPKSLPLLLL